MLFKASLLVTLSLDKRHFSSFCSLFIMVGDCGRIAGKCQWLWADWFVAKHKL
jgi:hypothetical protein